MDKSTEIADKCVSLCKVPVSYSEKDVISRANDSLTQSLLGSQREIVDIALIDAGEQQDFQRWILLFRSVKGAKAFLANVKFEEIKIGNEIFIAEYESSLACEIPEQWKTETPKVDDWIPPHLGGLDHQGVQQPSGPLPANQWPYAPEFSPNCSPSASVVYLPFLPTGQPHSGLPGYTPFGPAGYTPFGPSGQPPSRPPGYASFEPTGYASFGPTGQPPFEHTGQPPFGPTGQPPSGPTGQSPFGPTGQPPSGSLGYNPSAPILYTPSIPIRHPSSGHIWYTLYGAVGYPGPGQYVNYHQPYQWMHPMPEHNTNQFPPVRSPQEVFPPIRYPFVPNVSNQQAPGNFYNQSNVSPGFPIYPPSAELSMKQNIEGGPQDPNDSNSPYLCMFDEKTKYYEPVLTGQFIPLPSYHGPPQPQLQPQNQSQSQPNPQPQLQPQPQAQSQSQLQPQLQPQLSPCYSKQVPPRCGESRDLNKTPSIASVQMSVKKSVAQENHDDKTDIAEKATQIFVSNLLSDVNDEYLQMFFEKKQFGGFTVLSVEMLENNMAIIEFKEHDAVERFLKVIPIQIKGKTVAVEAYVPETVRLCTIEVRGPANVINQDELHVMQLYFENQTSGGEEIVKSNFDPQEKVTYITFQTEEVAKYVVEKGNHVLNKQKLDVKIHKPERKLPTKDPGKSQATDKSKEEEPQQAIHTVKVKGFPKLKSRGTLQLYFENNRHSGGGGEVTIESDEEDTDMLYVHFQEEDVAARVADGSRTHFVEGCDLIVSLHVPPKPMPCYENRVLLKGMKPTITKHGLFNFLETKTGCIPVGLTYHADKEDTAMVTFDKIDDIGKIKEAIRKYELEGATLMAYPVPVSNCILVSKLAQDVTKDTVQFYFENARSGGGPVNKVVMHDKDKSCLVYFNDYQVIDNVLHQEHKLNEKKLKVYRYLECLGVRDGEDGECKFRVPETIVISNTKLHKVKFLKEFPKYMDALEIQLKSCHAKLQWPSNENGNISIICTLTKDVADSFKLAKAWHVIARDNFEAFMKNIIIHQTNILQDIWDNVMEKLMTINIPNPEAVALFVDKKDCEVFVVGVKHVVSDLAKQISDTIKQITDQAEKERQQVKELVSNLKSIETEMLLADKFLTKMEAKFPDVKVHITQNKNEVMFEGVCSEVKEAKLAMFRIKEKFVEHTVDISKICEELYLTKQTKEHIVKMLKHLNLTAAWETSGKLLHICSSSKESLQDCVAIVQGSVKECLINIDTAVKSVINSPKWIKKVEEWQSAFLGKCKINYEELSTKIHVCATDDIFSDLCDSIKNYLPLNTIYEHKLSFERSIHRLIEKHHKDKVSEIAKSLQNSLVQINYGSTYNSFEIKGTNKGTAEAKKALQKLVNEVQNREHTMKNLGLGEYIQSIKGKDNINTVESTFPCVIEVTGHTVASAESEISKNIYETIPAHHKNGVRIEAQHKVLNCTIFSAEGDMTELPVDVLVNSTNEKLNLDHGLGSAMVAKGGQSIKTACDEHIRIHGSLKVGDVFMCKAGKLKAKDILHVVGPTFQDGNFGEDKMLKEAVLKSMKLACSKRNACCIAIPAISCGVFRYPVKQATAIIVEAVMNFVNYEGYNSSIKEVWLCDIKKYTVNCFTDALMQQFDKNGMVLHTIDDKMEVDTPVPLPKKELTFSLTGNDVTIGNVNISVIIGKLAQQKVDVIANTAAYNLDLKNGAVSASLLQAAGQKLQHEITQKYPHGIKGNKVAVTSGCKLNCKIVVHVALPNYKGDESVKALKNLMHGCLFEAHKQKFNSIAFPALGTGNLGFPKEIVAKEMFMVVSMFAKIYPQSSVNDVRFCLYHVDTPIIQAFNAEEGRLKTERSRSCTIRKIDSPYSGAQQNYSDKDNKKDHSYEDIPRNESIKHNNINITVKQGDITQEDTDCIVNSSNEFLDLSQGAVSQAILKKGGKTLAMELDRKKSEMKQQRLVVTSAPGLQCQKIIHVVAQQNIQGWIDIIYLCLQEADKHKMSSIAFPALGTAAGSVNPDEIATAMVKVVTEFRKSKPGSVKEVCFVIYQAKMVQSFNSAIKNIAGGLREKFVSNSFTGRCQNENDNARPQQLKRMQTHINSDEVTFIIWSLETDILEKAVKRLETLLQRETFHKEFKDSIIKQLTNFKVREIEAIGKQHHVWIDINTANGMILVSGITSNVMAVSDKIQVLIQDFSAAEQHQNATDLMSNVIEWSYIEVTQTGDFVQPYDKVLSDKIEMVFKQQVPSAEFKDYKGTKYILDFSQMLEYPVDDPMDSVKVIRRDRMNASSLECPKFWTEMSTNLRIVTLQATDPEYKNLAAKFTTSSGFNKIHKIERVQNKALWQQYQAKKKKIESQNPSTSNFTNEKLLWYGTDSETVDSINVHGFNRSYCGKNAVAFGNGVYFAVNASYSCSDTYSTPNQNGVKCMYYCCVLTGEYVQGHGRMRVPPNKPGAGSHALYDSVVDNVTSPSIYVIFHDTQAYPMYLISFSK